MVGTYEFVNNAIQKSKEFSDVTIESILDFPSVYCVSYSMGKAPKGDFYIDCFLSVDKKSGKVNEFNPISDMKSFKKASEDPIYIRSKDILRSDSFEKGKKLVHSMMR